MEKFIKQGDWSCENAGWKKFEVNIGQKMIQQWV
jgi:hypothetical protein